MTRPFFQGPFARCAVGASDLAEELPPFLAEWGWPKSLQSFIDSWLAEENAPNGVVLDYVTQLRERGVRCHVASTQEPRRARYLAEEMGFADRFDSLFFSCDVAAAKPDPEYFRRVAERLGRSPSQLILLDDSVANVEAARAEGWEAVLYESPDNLADVSARLTDSGVAAVPGPPTIETQRLLLRAPQPTDVDAIFEIQGNADAMRYTYAAPNREATVQHLASYSARFAEDGFAPWTVVLKSENRVIGWGGLNRDPKEPHWGPEVAYFLHPSCWGRGLATELVDASLRLGFAELGLAEIIAFTSPANLASQRVLTKAGFRFSHHVPELERDRYVISAGSLPDPGKERSRRTD